MKPRSIIVIRIPEREQQRCLDYLESSAHESKIITPLCRQINLTEALYQVLTDLVDAGFELLDVEGYTITRYEKETGEWKYPFAVLLNQELSEFDPAQLLPEERQVLEVLHASLAAKGLLHPDLLEQAPNYLELCRLLRMPFFLVVQPDKLAHFSTLDLQALGIGRPWEQSRLIRFGPGVI
ncbi:hypothetical protein GCM10027275_25210 [Rhabdobacter roseus]|uniref:Uncharacterized protein n=2 Tax=Rhabdobacter roseus TaxID=1655419 RepID=A0A840TSB5_9BACT|nr:hypothetical protein [Rhabdobacter roseus]